MNWLGQERVDQPMLRSIESAICADFDVVAGRAMAGSQALVVTGFSLANFAANTQATSIQLSTAASILFNVNATQSGTFIYLPASQPVDTLNPATNPNVQGSWTAGQTNYVGVDLTRVALAATSDVAQFIDPNTDLEVPKDVPLGLVMQYTITISTTPFSATPNITPIALVTLNSNGQVSSATGAVQDARNLMWRLWIGGDTPSTAPTVAVPTGTPYSYPWPQGRAEAPGQFTGGDKALGSLRDFIQAAESRIQEIGGGENWYSPTADRNVFFATTGLTAPLSNWFVWDGTNLLWTGLTFCFDNSDEGGVYYNTVSNQTTAMAGLTDLTNGQCIYVDLQRFQNANLTAVKTSYQLLGTPTMPGARQVIAVNIGGQIFTRGSSTAVGVPIPVAMTTVLGIVKLTYPAYTPLAPVVLNLDVNYRTAWASQGTAGYALQITGGNSASAAQADGGILATGGNNSSTGFGGNAGVFYGGTSTSASLTAGNGVIGTGGASSGSTFLSVPGSGIVGVGGNQTHVSGAAKGGDGGDFQGGTSDGSGDGGYGVSAIGGANLANGSGGYGVLATGGNSTGSNTFGGLGGNFTGGNSVGTAVGAAGLQGQGGSGGATANGGIGVYGAGGPAGGTSHTGGTGVVGIGRGTATNSITGGIGVNGSGGNATTFPGGYGGYFTGGNASTSGDGGIGVEGIGGTSGSSGAGAGGFFQGGASSTPGLGGLGIFAEGTAGQYGAIIKSSVTNVPVIDAWGYVYLGNGADPGTTNPGEHLNRRNTVIAWCSLNFDATAGTVTIVDGYNIASVLFSSGGIRINLTAPGSGTPAWIAQGAATPNVGFIQPVYTFLTYTNSYVYVNGSTANLDVSGTTGSVIVTLIGFL